MHKTKATTASRYTPEPSSFIPMLTTLIKSRYNADQKFLDLSAIGADTSFAASRCGGFKDNPKHTKFGAVLCKLIQEHCADVQTISFADNSIQSLLFFATLSDRVPGVVNLSFQKNKLNSYKDLEHILGSKFTSLRELVLVDNPIKQKEMGKTGSDATYRANIKKLFPSAAMLDFEPLVEAEISKYTLPPVSKDFFDSDGTAGVVATFLDMYLTAFDTDRNSLTRFYTDSSIFTLSVDLVSRSLGDNSSKSNRDRFSAWTAHDHNLDRIKGTQVRADKKYKGTSQIIKTINSLPGTAHPLRTDQRLFVIDTYQTPTHLFINLQGEFTGILY
jgi:nuclear RNA export factor